MGIEELVMVRMATEGTLRRAELAGLRWSGFDLVRRMFAVTNGVTYAKTTGTVLGALKNDSSYREVVLCEDLCKWLARYRESVEGEDAHFLFPGQPGKGLFDSAVPRNPNSLTKRVHEIIRDAGVLDECGSAYANLQGLRATGASLAEAAGAPIGIVEAQLGHTGASVYERNYRDLRRAPERFEFANAFEPAATGVPDSGHAASRNRSHLRLVGGTAIGA